MVIEKKSADFLSKNSASTSLSGVDFWFLDLSKITPEMFALENSILSPDEIIRASERKRNQHHFIATRFLLRKVLAHYTGIAAQHLLFSRSKQGKPFLTNSPFPIYFNLSHSGNSAVLAASTLGELGVDLEVVRPRDFTKITERYFHPDEHQQLQAATKEHGEILFYKLWTLKEAFFKALGSGISTGLDKVCFRIGDEAIAADFSPSLNIQQNEWQFYQVFVNSKIVIALAIKTGQPIQLQSKWFDSNSLLDTPDS